MSGKVYLLGAGPGDPELITERAARRLGEDDVVLYDALVHPDLLRRCKPGVELVFVGKRAGRASERQHEITTRMIAEARAGRVVARLKGGDPFLFGRGSEEAEALAAAGVPFEVVPGVTSPLAVCAYAGISLTHRDLASSVAFVTASESADKTESAHDWTKLATATQTLVIFMGARTLASIAETLIRHGRDPTTPAAVFEWASLPRQRTVVGTLATIAKLATDAKVGLPSLTVVGDVVTLRDKLRWYDRLPLFGKRVLVTRPAGQNDELSRALRDRGAEPISLPTIRITPPEDGGAALDHAVRHLQDTDWLVFTSANGVAAFFDALDRAGLDTRALSLAPTPSSPILSEPSSSVRARKGLGVAAIGPATAAALAPHGIRADVVPDEHIGEAAAAAIIAAAGESIRGARILLPRAAVARDALPDALRAAGAVVDVVTAYRTLGPSEDDARHLRELFDDHAIDFVMLTSSSTVERLMEVLGGEPKKLEGVRIASIGPVTTRTAEALGLRVAVTATEYTSEGLVAALERYATQGTQEKR